MTRTTRKHRKVDVTAVSSENADVVEGTRVARPDTQSRRVAGRRGKLRLMTEMPIDTLHEVFRQVDPVDLLHLSWASKRLRTLIMERSAQYIWKETFERLYSSDNPPPRCPEDIDIARYTRFLFNKKCMMCGVGNGYWTSWGMRLRTCSGCLRIHFTRSCFALQYVHTLPTISAKDGCYFLNRDIKDAKENGHFLEKQRKRMEGIESFLSWEKQCLRNRNKELDSVRHERQKAILKRLEEIGWKQSDIENVAGGRVPTGLPGFRPAKKLTNKDWQVLQPKLLERLGYLQERRELSLKQERLKSRWHGFFHKFRTWKIAQNLHQSFIPHLVDIAVLEPFRTAIFFSDAENVDFDIDEIDRTAKEWMKCRDTLVFSLLPTDIQERFRVEDFQHSLHSLVILRFTGFRPLPGSIDEVCGSRQDPQQFRGDPEDSNGAEIHEMLSRCCVVEPWNSHSQDLVFDIKGFEIGKDVLTFLGLDPYTTTFNDLLRCDRRFTCTSNRCWSGFKASGLNAVEMLEHDRHMHEERWTPAVKRWKAV